MELKIKKLVEDAVIPSQAHSNDAGYDLVAIDDGTVGPEGYIQYRTGLAIAPEPGYHTEIVCRSSISKYDLALANSVGIIDEGYRGELLVRFKFATRFMPPGDPTVVSTPVVYKKGDKIAQLIIRKTENASLIVVDDLSSTDRGQNGFGSTSK